MEKRFNVRIYGRVQGVGFRYFTLQRAHLLGVKGFVKNMPDGSVFVDCQGDEENLRIFFEYLKQGPRFAFVERLEKEEIPRLANVETFVVKR